MFEKSVSVPFGIIRDNIPYLPWDEHFTHMHFGYDNDTIYYWTVLVEDLFSYKLKKRKSKK